ncbi:transposase [Ichthyobacterium seriolicida]|uniref:transposase n=1 Tax=Ichthyobacterium seriolicida TaxID=242600 RepID=UPI0012FD2CF7
MNKNKKICHFLFTPFKGCHYNQTLSVYEAQNCQGCSIRTLCHKSKHNIRIERNHHLERQKNIMLNRLQQ